MKHICMTITFVALAAAEICLAQTDPQPAAAVSAEQATSQPAGQTVINIPHAGVSLSLPKGFIVNTPEEPFVVLLAGLESKVARPIGVTLTVLPVKEQTTSEAASEQLVTLLKNTLGFRDVELRKAIAASVAGMPGRTELLSYVCRSASCVAGRAILMRDLPDDAGRLCYILNVEATTDDQARVLPLLGGMLQSLKLTDLRHPVDMPVGALGRPMEDYKLSYGICAPAGWAFQQKHGGAVLAYSDYLAGGRASMTANVIVADVPASRTAKDYIEGVLAKAEQAPAGQGGARGKVVSSGSMRMADLDGHQAVVELGARGAAASRPATTSPTDDDAAGYFIYRTICVPSSGGARAYTIVLICIGGTVDHAAAVMDKLAEGFSLIKTMQQ